MSLWQEVSLEQGMCQWLALSLLQAHCSHPGWCPGARENPPAVWQAGLMFRPAVQQHWLAWRPAMSRSVL